jgi:hypothetical protein
MSNIYYIVLIATLWAICFIFIFLWLKWIKEKKNAWKLGLTGRIEEPKWLKWIKEKKNAWKLGLKIHLSGHIKEPKVVVQKTTSDVDYERAKKDLKIWKSLGTYKK